MKPVLAARLLVSSQFGRPLHTCEQKGIVRVRHLSRVAYSIMAIIRLDRRKGKGWRGVREFIEGIFCKHFTLMLVPKNVLRIKMS